MDTKPATRDAIKVCAAIATYVASMVFISLATKNAIIALSCTNIATAVCVMFWRKRHKADPLITKRPVDLMTYVGAILIIIIVNMGGANIALWVKQQLGAPSPIQSLINTTPLAIIIATSLIVAPLGEETLIRGFVYPIVRQHLSATLTIAITATAFALLHGNLVQMVLTLPLGIVLGHLYEHTHNLWLCIGAHMLFNALTVVLPSPTISTWNAGVVLILMITTLIMWMDTDVKKR